MRINRCSARIVLFFASVLSIISTTIARPAGVGTMAGSGRAGIRSVAPPTNVFPAQFRAVIFEVELPTNQSKAPDAAALLKHLGTTNALMNALSTSGKTRVFYRIDQPVNVFGERLLIGTSEPLVNNITTSQTGQTVSSVQTLNSASYVNFGAIIQLSASAPLAAMKRDTPDVKLSVQLSGLPPLSIVRLPPPAIEQFAPLEYDQPRLLASGVVPSSDGSGRPAAYVVRYEFGKPETTDKGSKTPGLVGANLPAQLQAEVYEIQATAERLAKLDSEKLTRDAATADSLISALNKTAKAQVLYRADQPVNVAADRVQVSTNATMTVSTSQNASRSMSTTMSQRQGLLVTLFAQPPLQDSKSDAPMLMISVQASSIAASDTDISPGQKASLIRTLNWQHSEALEFGKPRIAVVIRPSSSAPDAAPVAYVIRYLFKPPEPK